MLHMKKDTKIIHLFLFLSLLTLIFSVVSYSSVFESIRPYDFLISTGAPSYSSNENPANQSTDISVCISNWSVMINQTGGLTTNGSIEMSNGLNMTWTNQLNGTRTLNITSTLNYGKTYKIWLNFTDGIITCNETYFFTTELVSIDFTITYSGDSSVLTPVINVYITKYKWTIYSNDGVHNGSTGWINCTGFYIDHVYTHVFTDPSSITAMLSVQTNTTNLSKSRIVNSTYSPHHDPEEWEYPDEPDEGDIDDYYEHPWVPWSNDQTIFGVAIIIFMIVFSIYLLKRSEKTKIGNYVVYYKRRKSK